MTKFTTFLGFTVLFLLSITNLFSQDDCNSAVNLPVEMYSTCGQMALQSIDFNGATASTQAPDPTCGSFTSGTSIDLWYSFEVPAGTNTMAFHAFNSDVVPGIFGTSEPAMAIYRGTDCSSLTLLACFESNAGFMENGEIRWEQVSGLNPGETIYMRVWDQGNQDQQLFIAASVRLDMQEDDCDTPMELGTGGCNILSTGGDIAAPENCGWNTTDNSIFFYFTVEADDPQPYTITVEEGECWANSGGESPEIQFAVYEWNGSNCSGIGGSGSTYMGCANGTGTVTFSENLPAGDYVLAMDGYSMLSGNSLCLFGFDAPFVDPSDITINLNTTNESCGEMGTAAVTVITSCTGNPLIEWSTGETGNSISDLTAGNYSVTVTDGVDCDTVIENFTITADNNFSVDAYTNGEACDEYMSATAEVTGATAGQCSFVWSTTPTQTTEVAQINESGTYTVTATFGTCTDTDDVTINLFDHIIINNFSDNICNGTNTEYTVSFDVSSTGGGSVDFNVDTGTGSSTYTDNFSTTFPSGTAYNITITDMNGCDIFNYNGLTDCGCSTFAGTMGDLTPLTLCADECSDLLTHNGDEYLEGDDILEFIVHDGEYPGNIIARNSTPEFCFSDLSSGDYGVTYYISAIAGNDVGGFVSQSDPCYSQSPGTPVVWFENPIAFISANELTTCGLEITLTASEPEEGMTGSWSSPDPFFPVGGTSINSPSMSVIVGTYADQEFTFSVNNGICAGTDNVIVHFLETPTAYAGDDYTICGNVASLTAVQSVSGSTGQWSGNGSFSSASNPETDVTAGSFGEVSFTWRENVGICWDEDNVNITFIQEPNPTVTTVYDTVCGNTAEIEVVNVTASGSWAAYYEGAPLSPAPDFESGVGAEITNVTIGNYPADEYSRTIEFIWTETSQQNGVECTASATTWVTFSREPVASVGPEDAAEICGSCFTFNADTTGSGWAIGTWISPNVIATFDDENIPDAEVCIDPLGSYGDSAYVSAPFIWAMRNTGCTSVDTMFLTFYKQPEANAGLDDKICGPDYELGAVYSLVESANYSPSGMWSVYEKPIPSSSADINPTSGDTVNVTVSHYGEWVFQFRENNSNLPSCYTTDTVRIEFVEIPIISAGDDQDVCGTGTQMQGTPGGFNGTWIPNGMSYDDYNDPTTEVSSPSYGAIDFIWLESNDICSAKDTVTITFWRQPEATILTDLEDSTTCGYTFCNLRAESPGSEITGYWYTESPATMFDDPFDVFACATVPTYGYHDFYWIEETGPDLEPGFCTDTAGPLTIHFIETPVANAGIDTLFCGYSGYLHAFPSTGTGVWSTPSEEVVEIESINDPESYIESDILNTGNPTYPYFTLIWTEDASNGCTDKDTVQVIFARIPISDMDIIPPKCFGEPATIAAAEDTLQQYTWNFFTGAIDSTTNNMAGGEYQNFVYWNSEDTLHRVSLIATNSWGCQSPITIDTVHEPSIPDFNVTLFSDTCMLDKGGIIFEDTLGNNAFYWLDTVVGPAAGTPITTVYNLPTGDYYIGTSYLTENTAHYAYYIATFGTQYCTDTVLYEIEPIGMIEALIEVSAATDLGSLVAPEASVIFLNNSIYDNVGKRCEWHFGDETTEKNCDAQVEHIYTEGGCYEPYLIVMNRDLPECRDTAFLETCIPVDNSSEIEVPNVFSPNGDGINDFFQVKAQTLRTFSGIIVNRYGRTVFEWDNWEDYEAGWDGKINGGTNASRGVYYYIIKAEGMDDIEYDLHGPLHLVKD